MLQIYQNSQWIVLIKKCNFKLQNIINIRKKLLRMIWSQLFGGKKCFFLLHIYIYHNGNVGIIRKRKKLWWHLHLRSNDFKPFILNPMLQSINYHFTDLTLQYKCHPAILSPANDKSQINANLGAFPPQEQRKLVKAERWRSH